MSNLNKPKFKVPEYTTTLPVSGHKVIYRGYNVADERVLMAAASSKKEDIEFYIQNTLNILSGVVLNDIDINRQPSIDARWLMLNVRGKSVGEEIEFELNKQHVVVDIRDFYVTGKRSKEDYNIKLNDEYGMIMKELTFEEEVRATAGINEENKSEVIYRMMIDSVDSIYTKDDLWKVGETLTKGDVEEFLADIPSNVSKKLYEYIAEMPTLAVDVEINGKKQTITNKEVDFLSSAPATSQ